MQLCYLVLGLVFQQANFDFIFELALYQLSVHISRCPMTVAMASSIPSGGYLYFFSSFSTMQRIPSRSDSFFCKTVVRLFRSKYVSSCVIATSTAFALIDSWKSVCINIQPRTYFPLWMACSRERKTVVTPTCEQMKAMVSLFMFAPVLAINRFPFPKEYDRYIFISFRCDPRPELHVLVFPVI